MKKKYFIYHELHCVHSLVGFIIECIEIHLFEDIEEKDDGGGLDSNTMTARLLFMQLLKKIKIIFWDMAMKSMTIYFQLLITDQVLQVKLTNWYINREGNGMEYTIGGK